MRDMLVRLVVPHRDLRRRPLRARRVAVFCAAVLFLSTSASFASSGASDSSLGLPDSLAFPHGFASESTSHVIPVFGSRDGGDARDGSDAQAAPKNRRGLPEVKESGIKTKIVGTIIIVGNEPHTEARIKDESTGETWRIIPAETERLAWDLQGSRVEFTGKALSPDGARGRVINPRSWKIVK